MANFYEFGKHEITVSVLKSLLLFNSFFYKLRNKYTIEFELKSFNNQFNQQKETNMFISPKCKFGVYDWFLAAQVKTNPDNNELNFVIYHFCESENKINFPVFANSKFSILNVRYISSKDFSICNLIFIFHFENKIKNALN